MTEEQIRLIIHDELQEFLASDRYIFHKNIQILDGRNIQVGTANGLKIGTETTQKIAFHGITPCVQAGAISSPSAPSAIYVQVEAASAKSAIDDIITALKNKGLTA